MWPWSARRAAAEDTHEEVVAAEQQAREAEERRRAVDRLVNQSRGVSAALRREIAKNGWTELLENAWGAR